MAREAFSAEQTKKANDLNLIAEMIDWIYERDVQDVNGQIRLNMFTLTKSLQEQAVDAHVEDYRGRRKVTHQVSIGEYSTEVNFKREDEEYSKVSAFFTQKRDGAVAEIKAGNRTLVLALAQPQQSVRSLLDIGCSLLL